MNFIATQNYSVGVLYSSFRSCSRVFMCCVLDLFVDQVGAEESLYSNSYQQYHTLTTLSGGLVNCYVESFMCISCFVNYSPPRYYGDQS